MKRYCFDVDGTICTQTPSDYKNAKPIAVVIEKINKLSKEGNRIIISTARGQASGTDWEEYTKQQLRKWGVRFDEFYMKPSADYYIDDKGVSIGDFIRGNY